MEIYTRKQVLENRFELKGPYGNVLKNHNGKPYPSLSENISRNLISDLNYIAIKYYQLPEENDCIEEAVYNNLLATISGQELRQSFGYCLLSSLIEYQDSSKDVELEVEMQLQWDRLFRLNVLSNGGELELKATQNARAYFKGSWLNFGLNYSQNFEEMKTNEVCFVSDDIINEVKKLIDEMQFSHKIAINILYNFFECFSISVPVLWVSGIINDEDFIAGYYALNYGVDIFELDEEAYEEPRFLMNRLLFFKTILWGYSWKDETLPCFDY